VEPRNEPPDFHERSQSPPRRRKPKAKDRYWLHLLLFVATLASTVFAGIQMTGRFDLYETEAALFTLLGMEFTRTMLLDGLRFGGSLLLFLTVHEFGHYFAAKYHGIATSLPYYIPFPVLNPIGTFGAVIRIREPIPSLKKLFDVGAAGPLAGFVVAVGVLLYGLFTLPPPSYMFDLAGHDEVIDHIREFGTFPDEMPPLPEDDPMGGMRLVVGQTPLYWMLTQFFQDVPPMYEMYHYPYLFAGWLGLFFTALNLLPVGQLDGGHVMYALVGKKWHARIARGFVALLLVSGSVGFMYEAGTEITAAAAAFNLGWLAPLAPWLAVSLILYLFLRSLFKDNLRLIVPALLATVLFTAVALAVEPIAETVGYSGWFVWCLLIMALIKTDHPPVLHYKPLSPTRRKLAILNIIIFMLCFSLKPFYFA